MAHEMDTVRGAGIWRKAIWGLAVGLLLLPLLAMQVTTEVRWDLADFLLFGVMLAAVCGAWELVAHKTGNRAYRAGAALALVGVFALLWVNLAVGLIGGEANPANLLFGGVLAIGLVFAIAGRFQPAGMARAMVSMALAQALVAMIALLAGWSAPAILTFGFAGLWLASAWLFRIAARQASRGKVA